MRKGGMNVRSILILIVGVPIVLILIGGVLLPTIQSGFPTSSVSAATDFLEDKGYVVLSSPEFDLLAKESTAATAVANAEAAVIHAELAADAAQETLETLLLHNENEVFLWPESVSDTCTFQAGALADAFGNWTEIADNHGVKLSANFTTVDGYLVEIMTHDYTPADKIAIIELATDGAGANVIGRIKVRGDWTYVLALRSGIIPHGSLLYYRMKSETGNATLLCDFRYYYK